MVTQRHDSEESEDDESTTKDMLRINPGALFGHVWLLFPFLLLAATNNESGRLLCSFRTKDIQIQSFVATVYSLFNSAFTPYKTTTSFYLSHSTSLFLLPSLLVPAHHSTPSSTSNCQPSEDYLLSNSHENDLSNNTEHTHALSNAITTPTNQPTNQRCNSERYFSLV
jgi:hypothetical protein